MIIAIVINYLLDIVTLLVFIRCILSWIPGFYNRFVEVVYKLTDPILSPAQNLISKLMGGRSIMVDLSPIVVLFAIRYLIKPIIFTILGLFI